VKRTALADYRVVYFATHGLVAGEIKGLAEPSLVLTLPKRPSDTDDGLLTASEVAQLKLNAHWVVLSACNTTAGDKPGDPNPSPPRGTGVRRVCGSAVRQTPAETAVRRG
jgi:CHAT domain-containing protein